MLREGRGHVTVMSDGANVTAVSSFLTGAEA